jgi:hypothetical protein
MTRVHRTAGTLAFMLTIAGTGCSGDYKVEYPQQAKFCVVKSYGDQLHPELAASFRDALYASNEEGFTFVPDKDCDGAFVISTTYTPDPPASCVSRGQDAGAAGAGFLVAAIVEAACRGFRASRNVVFTEVFVIEKEKGWKVDAKLWQPVERGAPAGGHGAQMASDLARHLAESRAD